MIGAKLSYQKNSSNAGRFKSTNQRLASRGFLAFPRENRGKPSAPLPSLTLSTLYPGRANSRWRPHYEFRFFSDHPTACVQASLNST